MIDPDELLAEFDEDESGVEPPEETMLTAAIADPTLQEASVVNPNTGLAEKAPLDSRVTRWRNIPMPVREKAFFLWIEYGDFPTVASKLGMTVQSVRALAERDQWRGRAEELRVGLEQSLGNLLLENRREAARMALAILGEMDPRRVAALLDGKDAVRLILGMAGSSGRAQPGSLTVETGGGPAQVNLGPAQPEASQNLRDLSDEELARAARARGVDVQAAPGVLDRPPPSLPEPDSGGQSQSS